MLLSSASRRLRSDEARRNHARARAEENIVTSIAQNTTFSPPEARTPALRSAFDSPDPWLNVGFLPDSLAPAQFYDLIRRRNIFDGETRLVLAVLEDAIRCYLKNMHATRPRARAQFAEVEQWIEADPAPGQVFSFTRICDVLDVDPGFLRAQIKLLSPADLPTKHLRSVARRQQVRPAREHRGGSRRRRLSSAVGA